MLPSIHYHPVVPFLDGLLQENTSTDSMGDEEQQVYTPCKAITESVRDKEQQVYTPHNAITDSTGHE